MKLFEKFEFFKTYEQYIEMIIVGREEA